MAFITADRVKDTSTTTGTGNITVSGSAPFGYRTFSTVLSASDTFYYCIQGQATAEWEVGLGTYVSSNQFARTTVLASSASGSAVSFSSGTKNVFITLPANKTLQLDAAASPTAGAILYGTGSMLAYTAVGTSGQFLQSTGSGAPTWAPLGSVGTSISNGNSNVNIASSNGAVTVATNGTTAMTVDTSQNVGIGTTSPSQKLDVNGTILAGKSGTSTGYIGLLSGTSTNTGYAAFYNSAGTRQAYIGYIGSPNDALNIETDSGSNKPIRFATNSTEAARIDTSGNLLVGTTTASAKFAISSGATASIYVTNTNSNDFFVVNMNQGNSSGTAVYVMPMRFGNTTLAGSIYWNGTNVVYNTSSDYRLKKDIFPLSGGLSRINALKPSAYTWIEQNLPGEGFIAHELQEFIPHAVTGLKDAVNEDGSISPQQIDMTHIVPHLVVAIQELSAKNDALEARLVALEAK